MFLCIKQNSKYMAIKWLKVAPPAYLHSPQAYQTQQPGTGSFVTLAKTE